MPFLDPSSFLLPSLSEAADTKETTYTALFFKKPRRLPIMLLHPRAHFFLSNPSPKLSTSPDLFLKVSLYKPEWISMAIILFRLHPNLQKEN